MRFVTVISRDQSERQIELRPGSTLMEDLRDGGVDDILALCGGCCSCATCHVYLHPPVGDPDHPLSEEEDGLLDSSDHRLPESRLACQVRSDAVAENMAVKVAPED